jgi:hypothetical protein
MGKIKTVLGEIEQGVEREIDALRDREIVAERALERDLDDVAARARSGVDEMERELDAALTEDARRAEGFAERVEQHLRDDLESVTVGVLRELDESLERAHVRVRRALATRSPKA